MSSGKKDKSSHTRALNRWRNAYEKIKPEIKELTFIKELKQKYRQQYDHVQPIPYVKEKLFSIEMVFVEGGMEYSSGSSWMKMGSYNECVIAPPKSAKRSFILGGAGYGKSTLALQYAYDWCNNVKHSFLRNYEIMILLRLRQLAGVPSIFTAIKRFILPKHSTINESDIEQILGAATSVVFILDGLDEYPEEDFVKDCDVMKIILNKMFQSFEIIITSRYLPGYGADIVAKRLRLTGFSCDAQKRYIQKAVVNDKIKAQKIMQDLHDNPVMEDFCQMPLFFVMFAHMSHEENKEDFASFKTVTAFFRNMIKCFHTHMRNKLKDANVQQYFLYEKDHRELDLLAFRGLRDRGQIVWSKEYLRERLGGGFYDQYVRIGILVEEEVLTDDHNFPDKTQTDVRFYHKLFCEWYAAHYVAYVVRSEAVSLQDFLKRLDPTGNEYMYRFACGLSHEASEKIITYVKGKTDGSKFAILCIMEQDGNTENVMDTVKDLCAKKVVLARDHSNLLQRSTIQILELASKQGVKISEVWLHDYYESFDFAFGKLHLSSSKFHLPVLDTLRELNIRGQTEVPKQNFNDALHYASLCPHLKKLGFHICLVPKIIDNRIWLSILHSRNVQVLWYLNNQSYILNFELCSWETKTMPD